MSRTGHPGLDRAAADATAPEDVSASRARQVWWIAGDLGRALRHREHPLSADAALEEVFAASSVLTYLRLGEEGQLRVRQAKNPTVKSDKTTRTRIEALGILAAAAGLEAELPRLPADPPPKTPVDTRSAQLLHATLRFAAGPAALRMLALAGDVLDTGARAGEACAQTLDDLAPDLRRIRVRRRPQGTVTEGPTVVELVALRESSRAAMAAWLVERSRMVAHLEGGATALGVSTRHNHGGTVPPGGRADSRPAGTPLMPRGGAVACIAVEGPPDLG